LIAENDFILIRVFNMLGHAFTSSQQVTGKESENT